MVTSPQIRVKRVYEEKRTDDGCRVLVDRLWPRGMSKERAALDEWLKTVAPSPDLRRWYGHAPDRFEEFATRYRHELTGREPGQALAHLRRLAADGPLTLLTAVKNPEISEAAVLLQVLTSPQGEAR